MFSKCKSTITSKYLILPFQFKEELYFPTIKDGKHVGLLSVNIASFHLLQKYLFNSVKPSVDCIYIVSVRYDKQ